MTQRIADRVHHYIAIFPGVPYKTIARHLEEVHGVNMPDASGPTVTDDYWVAEFHEVQHNGGYSEHPHEHLTYEEAIQRLNEESP